MAGNYNYTTKMSRNQFYNEYAPYSLMASNARQYPDFKESHLFTSPGYRDQSLNSRGDGTFYNDFQNAYNRYVTTFDGRVAAQAAANRQIAEQKATAERLRIQQEQRIQRINTNAAATRGSLQILGQEQPMAPTAQMAEKKKGTRGVRQTATNISRGSSRSRGTNLSI